MKSIKVLFIVLFLMSSVAIAQRQLGLAFSPVGVEASLVPGMDVKCESASREALPSAQLNHAQLAFRTRNVAIVLYEGVELLDFAGPGEVFTHAGTPAGESAFNVYTVGTSTEPLMSQGFLTIKPQYSFANAPKPDIVVFPGGDVKGLLNDKAGMSWSKAAAQDAEIAMSVCNGASILAEAKMLDNKRVTSHWAAIPGLRKRVPTATVLENIRFVDNGQVITTAGVSAGIDGALHVVERLLGAPTAKSAARMMEYNWQPEKLASEVTSN
jgi:transcriptional regulator GlxA family with amidase domain